jgi:hypothetical protein
MAFGDAEEKMKIMTSRAGEMREIQKGLEPCYLRR